MRALLYARALRLALINPARCWQMQYVAHSVFRSSRISHVTPVIALVARSRLDLRCFECLLAFFFSCAGWICAFVVVSSFRSCIIVPSHCIRLPPSFGRRASRSPAPLLARATPPRATCTRATVIHPPCRYLCSFPPPLLRLHRLSLYAHTPTPTYHRLRDPVYVPLHTISATSFASLPYSRLRPTHSSCPSSHTLPEGR